MADYGIGIWLSDQGGGKFKIVSGDTYPTSYYRYWDIRDEPWNMDNPDANYGWHMLQGWTSGSNISNAFYYTQWGTLQYLEFRMRCSTTAGGSGFGWTQSDAYTNPAYVPPRPADPTSSELTVSFDGTNTVTVTHLPLAPSGYYTKLDKRVWSNRLQSYVDASYNPIASPGWRGVDTWYPNNHYISNLEPLDYVNFSAFYRSNDETWSSGRAISGYFRRPPEPSCWFEPTEANINGTTVYIIPYASTSYTTTFDKSVNGGSYAAHSGSYNIQNMVIGDTIRFRARYINVGSDCVIAGNASSWGWGYSPIYTRKNYRPDNFVGFNDLYSGKSMSYYDSYSMAVVVVPKTTWDALCARVNDFLLYKGKSLYSFSPVYSGNTFYALYYNQIIDALKLLSVAYESDKVTAGITPISAGKLLYLQNQLNSIT